MPGSSGAQARLLIEQCFDSAGGLRSNVWRTGSGEALLAASLTRVLPRQIYRYGVAILLQMRRGCPTVC